MIGIILALVIGTNTNADTIEPFCTNELYNSNNLAIYKICSTELGDEKINRIKKEFKRTIEIFEKKYEKSCEKITKEKRATIAVIDFFTLNDSRYFKCRKGLAYFGRYFVESNVIYVSEKIFKKEYEYDLNHEILHYLFYNCGPNYNDIDREHRIIDEMEESFK